MEASNQQNTSDVPQNILANADRRCRKALEDATAACIRLELEGIDKSRTINTMYALELARQAQQDYLTVQNYPPEHEDRREFHLQWNFIVAQLKQESQLLPRLLQQIQGGPAEPSSTVTDGHSDLNNQLDVMLDSKFSKHIAPILAILSPEIFFFYAFARFGTTTLIRLRKLLNKHNDDWGSVAKDLNLAIVHSLRGGYVGKNRNPDDPHSRIVPKDIETALLQPLVLQASAAKKPEIDADTHGILRYWIKDSDPYAKTSATSQDLGSTSDPASSPTSATSSTQDNVSEGCQSSVEGEASSQTDQSSIEDDTRSRDKVGDSALTEAVEGVATSSEESHSEEDQGQRSSMIIGGVQQPMQDLDLTDRPAIQQRTATEERVGVAEVDSESEEAGRPQQVVQDDNALATSTADVEVVTASSRMTRAQSQRSKVATQDSEGEGLASIQGPSDLQEEDSITKVAEKEVREKDNQEEGERSIEEGIRGEKSIGQEDTSQGEEDEEDCEDNQEQVHQVEEDNQEEDNQEEDNQEEDEQEGDDQEEDSHREEDSLEVEEGARDYDSDQESNIVVSVCPKATRPVTTGLFRQYANKNHTKEDDEDDSEPEEEDHLATSSTCSQDELAHDTPSKSRTSSRTDVSNSQRRPSDRNTNDTFSTENNSPCSTTLDEHSPASTAPTSISSQHSASLATSKATNSTLDSRPNVPSQIDPLLANVLTSLYPRPHRSELQWEQKYGKQLRDFSAHVLQLIKDDTQRKHWEERNEHRQNCVDWLGEVVWAHLGGKEWIGQTEASWSSKDAPDALVVSEQEFLDRSTQTIGLVPVPILIQGSVWRDPIPTWPGAPDPYTISGFLARLDQSRHLWGESLQPRKLSVQNVNKADSPRAKPLWDIGQAFEGKNRVVRLLDSDPAVALNLLDIPGNVLPVDRPQALTLIRYMTLQHMCEAGLGFSRDDQGSKKKSRKDPEKDDQGLVQGLLDLQASLSFTICGNYGSFSQAHCDHLDGTWLRCIDGVKAWMIVQRMGKQDWIDWHSQSDSNTPWCPKGRTRILIIEKGDVIWMPAGAKIVHAPLTIEPCIMTGGSFWDVFHMELILEHVQEMYDNNEWQTNENTSAALLSTVKLAAHQVKSLRSDVTKRVKFQSMAELDAIVLQQLPRMMYTSSWILQA